METPQNPDGTSQNPYNNPQANPYGGPYYQPKEKVPNSTTTLVLGIVTIALDLLCCCSIISLATGIIAVVMGYNGRAAYAKNPEKYDRGSYLNLNAGFICGIVGLILMVFSLIILVIIVVTDPEFMREMNRALK